MKIGFFTPRSVDPLHPRLVAFRDYFRKKGITPVFINQSQYKPALVTRINWLSLWFFDFYAIRKCKPLVNDFDIIVVNDLKYLPLVRFAKRQNKTVIYDTIDHNVYLRLHQLEKKVRPVRLLRTWLAGMFKKLELRYALRYCDEILVNSDSLKAYFHNRAHALYYASPLENVTAENNPDNETALLYLGAFTRDKGAEEILSLRRKLKCTLLIYGYAEKEFSESLSEEGIFYKQKISTEELRSEMEKHLTQNFLMGVSLIRPAHYSYEVQEANKDIDYLAMGIPILGNHRWATAQKIEAGCGIYYDDPEVPDRIRDNVLKKQWSIKALELYRAKYFSEHFSLQLEKILRPYWNTRN